MEYSRLGNVISGQEKAVAKSKYDEDVLINNHTVRTCSVRTSVALTQTYLVVEPEFVYNVPMDHLSIMMSLGGGEST